MFRIIENLNPAKLYTFKSVGAGSTLPLTIKEFLSTKFGSDDIDLIGLRLEKTTQQVWSKSDGWNPDAYAQHVRDLVASIDATKVIHDDFIESALSENLSVFKAVDACFKDSPITIGLQLHAQGQSGFFDVDIQGIGSVTRVVYLPEINNGDMFNVYYDESSKGAAVWDTDLKKSLTNYLKNFIVN